jgi:hypothetical protein
MTDHSASALAWDLVEHARSDLDAAQLNTAFVRLGAGDYEFVIRFVLGILPHIGMPLTPDLMSCSQAWVNGYQWSSNYPRLLTLLTAACPVGHARMQLLIQRVDQVDDMAGENRVDRTPAGFRAVPQVV